MSHPFVVGGQYQNSKGTYIVQAINDDRMTIRYLDGSEQNVNIDLQARIWQRIQDEENRPAASYRPGDYDSLETQPVAELVQLVLKEKFSSPYPGDIIDQVCLAIENKPEWLKRYHNLVELFSSRGKDGKLTVNSSIGWYTKDLTGLKTLKAGTPAKSQLIESFSTLGNPMQNK